MRLPAAVALVVLCLPKVLAATPVPDAPARAEKARREALRRLGVPRLTPGTRGIVGFPFSVNVGPNGTVWDLSNNGGTGAGPFSGFCFSGPGVSADEAGTKTASDAYDVAYTLWVNGSIFAAATADVTGTTFTVGPVPMSGLNVTRQLFFSPTRQVMRVLDTFQNPTGGTITPVIEMPVNFGSDAGTQVEATSSGDLIFTTADRWLITSDGGPADPVNTTVIWGPGAPLTPASVTQAVFECSSPDGAGWTFNLPVPAGATRRLLYFAGLEDMLGTGNTVVGAIANAAIFNDAMALHNTTDLTSGLTNAELLQIVNWDFSFVPVELQSFTVGSR
jgi:hypothetical protein